jgi:hypothetical protein
MKIMDVPTAISIIEGIQPEIMRAPHLKPEKPELVQAYRTFPQPARVEVQALAGLGELLPKMRPGSDEKAYLIRRNNRPSENRFANIARALLSNVFLELPPELVDVFVQEASEALESGPARLVSSVPQVKWARRVHIVTDDGSRHVFLRAVQFGEFAEELEIQSNFTGPAIQRDPIGTLSRATMLESRWHAEPGWWVVQPPGGYRAETSEMLRLRRLLPPAPRPQEKPKAQANKPESNVVPTPKTR